MKINPKNLSLLLFYMILIVTCENVYIRKFALIYKYRIVITMRLAFTLHCV